MQYKDFLKKSNITPDFPPEIINEINDIPDAPLPTDLAHRRDLTALRIVTIDGADAKDLDDAVSIDALPDGSYRLGVHIADVSHYVREGTALDREAQARGTSVYLIDQVVPMLPPKLSNGICSLNPHVPRLTLSVFMDISPSGEVEHYEICESFIKTANRMTYSDVAAIHDGDSALRKKYRDHLEDFENMAKLAEILGHKRYQRGSLDFDLPEPKIILDPDGKPLDIFPEELTFANKIIEEFMLVCNETVAHHMENLEIPLVYRVHEDPQPDKMAIFAQMIKALGIKTRITSQVTPKKLQGILDIIKDTDSERAVSTIMLRSLMKARYCEENLGHFGLAAPYYCHFTSPIRRYPDLAVHRIVKDWLHNRLTNHRKATLARYTAQVAKESSEAEVAAVVAEREWNKYKMCEYMEEKLGEEYDAHISSVTSFGLYVELPNLIEGLIPIRDLQGDYYVFDELHNRLTGRRTGVVFKIGDKIKVKLVRVNTELCQIDFIPLSTPKQQKSDSFDKHPKTHRRRRAPAATDTPAPRHKNRHHKPRNQTTNTTKRPPKHKK